MLPLARSYHDLQCSRLENVAQTKWQYFVLGYKLDANKRGNRVWMSVDGGRSESISDSLKSFGEDGWELVNTIFLENSEETQGPEIMCFFKKPA
jgi:hypothetical protein